MSYVFNPPTEAVTYPVEGALTQTLQHGVTVVVTDGEVYQVRYPTHEELVAADSYYLGGYVHRIEQPEADILAAAGLGDYITDYVPPENPPEDPDPEPDPDPEEPVSPTTYDAAVSYDADVSYDDA